VKKCQACRFSKVVHHTYVRQKNGLSSSTLILISITGSRVEIRNGVSEGWMRLVNFFQFY